MSTPGWYPDPAGSGQQRYFDGNSWTTNFAPTPPAPKAPTKSKAPKIIGGVVAAVVGLIVIGNLSGGDKDKEVTSKPSPASPVATQTAAAASKADQPAPAGSLVRDGKFEFQVLGIERGARQIEDAFSPEIAKGEFFTVKLRVTNIGNEPRSFSATNQKLIINGNEYAATSIMDEGWLEEINPGLGIDAGATFDIPPGATPSAIELHDSMFSGGALLAL